MSMQTMSKRLKYIFGVLLSLAVLGGCREEMPSLGTASSNETTESTDASADVTTAVPATEKTETEASVSQTEVLETVSEEDEQAALEKLILEAAGETGNPYAASYSPSIFGDFDNDGKNEYILVVNGYDDRLFPVQSVWFASGDKTEKIVPFGNWLTPEIVTSCGNTFIKVEYWVTETSPLSRYFLLKNSSVISYNNIIPAAGGIYPDGEYGDFRASYNPDREHERSGIMYQTYWFYYLNDKFSEYAGKEITEKEFLEYDGAQAVLDEMSEKEFKLKNILKRSNGIITVNGVTEDDWYCYRVLKYRNGKVTCSDVYNDGFYVEAVEDNYKQTDFERFSEMIYDTAEGDENSFIRERFYGNIDGKNALYAYYGTDENFSLWYADKDGAKKVTENTELFCADGDVLMKRDGGYFVMKNGKPKKLDIMGAENFTMLPDGSFTGIVKSGYSDSQKTEETKKPYWFRYRDGTFSDCIGVDITEEELLGYGGGRAALDEVAARGGDLVNIVRRENGIININYALHNQTTTKRFFMTLEIGDDNKLTDITPKKEDGTPDNAGWYLHSLKISQ